MRVRILVGEYREGNLEGNNGLMNIHCFVMHKSL